MDTAFGQHIKYFDFPLHVNSNIALFQIVPAAPMQQRLCETYGIGVMAINSEGHLVPFLCAVQTQQEVQKYLLTFNTHSPCSLLLLPDG